MADSARFVCKISTSVAPRLERLRAKSAIIWPAAPLNASPERERAGGTVYWQAEYAGRPSPNVIKAVVGEVHERTAAGLKSVIYINTFHPQLPEFEQLEL